MQYSSVVSTYWCLWKTYARVHYTHVTGSLGSIEFYVEILFEFPKY